MKNKLKTLAVIAGIAMMVQPASATIKLVLGDGVDPGSSNRQVDIGPCIYNTIAVRCLAGGSATCPTTPQIREICPGALIVNWIPVASLNDEVQHIQALWASGTGTLSGSYNKEYLNVTTGEKVQIPYSWTTNALNQLELIIGTGTILPPVCCE